MRHMGTTVAVHGACIYAQVPLVINATVIRVGILGGLRALCPVSRVTGLGRAFNVEARPDVVVRTQRTGVSERIPQAPPSRSKSARSSRRRQSMAGPTRAMQLPQTPEERGKGDGKRGRSRQLGKQVLTKYRRDGARDHRHPSLSKQRLAFLARHHDLVRDEEV